MADRLGLFAIAVKTEAALILKIPLALLLTAAGMVPLLLLRKIRKRED